MSTAIAMNRLTLISHLHLEWTILLAESDLCVFIYLDDDIFHPMACSVASFGTFVTRTLQYTAYRCTVVFCCRFFCFVFSTILNFCLPYQWTNDEMQIRKLIICSPCLSRCSNRKRVQLNMFSLSSLISRIPKSVVRFCLQYPISFSPFN